MKPITKRAKQRYFMNYVGMNYERMLNYTDGTSRILGPYRLSVNDITTIDCFWKEQFPEVGTSVDTLYLRSFDSMTNEELINVAKIVSSRHNRHYKPEEITYEIHPKRKFDIILLVKNVRRFIIQIDSDGLGFVDYYMGGAGSIHYYAPGQYAATGYLQSIGIALPFYDYETGVEYSVKDLVENNTIKLINVE